MTADILGKWAVIDLETTGIDPMVDQIIDVGLLQFEGSKLVRKYSSLVYYEFELSQFIQKLTGINSKMLKKAPDWESVKIEFQELEGHKLLAHNARFESSFLAKTFEELGESRDAEEFVDSLHYLSLLHVGRENLNLESFILDYGIKNKEEHRGLADAEDMLKVVLLSTYLYKTQYKGSSLTLKSLFQKYQLENEFWWAKFFSLNINDLIEIAEQLDFSLPKMAEEFLQKSKVKDSEVDEIEIIDKKSLDFSGKNIQEILQNESSIKKTLPFYSYRKSQEDLAVRTGQSFKNKVHSLIQAPTGTGKTLGYFIPSALFALENREQVLLATGTKTLQHQAYFKDVPEVRKILNLGSNDLKTTLLIGSGNHLCELLFRDKQREEDLFSTTLPWAERFSLLYFEMIFAFNIEHEYSQKLTRGNLPYALKRSIEYVGNLEKEIAVDFRACIGSRCPFKNECSYLSGLREAKEAHIILGNHTLMFTWPKGFPRPRYMVVDEAHRLEKEATSTFTLTFSQVSFENLVKNLIHLQGIGALFYLLGQAEGREQNAAFINKIKEEINNSLPMLTEHLEELKIKTELYFKRTPRFTSQFWNEVPMPQRERVKDSLEVSLFNHFESVLFILDNIYKMLLPYLSMWSRDSLQREEELMAYGRFENFMGPFEDLLTALSTSLGTNEEYARSLKFHVDEGFVAEAAPINVGKIIYEQLLSGSESVVMTSATLGQVQIQEGSKGIEWATGHLYVNPEKRFKKGFYLPPVYDYEKNSKVYLCDDTPALNSSEFVPNVMNKLFPLLKELGGHSLILFSARARFEVAREVLLKEFSTSLPIFIQGMGNRVVDEYKASPQGILLGMESFGEGIDIPGDALQFVFIDKIPDLRIDLVTSKRREFYEREFGHEFNDYYLAARSRSLHQKLGRLLRTVQDRGAAIVVDSRVGTWKSKTVQTFLEMMAPYKMERASFSDAIKGSLEFIKENTIKK